MQRRLIYFVYRLVLAAAFPFLLVYLVVRGVRDRRYWRSLPERLGLLPSTLSGTADGSVWLHAVSVGEVLSSIRLLERMRAAYPARVIFVSSTTLAGKAVAAERLAGLVQGVFYAPIDYCFAVRRVLRRLRPSVVVVAETEIWPNLYREVKRTGAGLMVVNGRISDRAFPKYQRWRWCLRHVLAWPDVILAQNEQAASRYAALDAPPERVQVAGNLKYDFDPSGTAPPEAVARLVAAVQPGSVWIAASTMPPAHGRDVDEDDIVLDAFSKLASSHPSLLLIQVPRRPERFAVVAAKLQARGIPFVRRSELDGSDQLPLPAVLLLDSMGELSGIFPMGTAVFMGGTLAERGGHNILEPAFFGRPVVIGPHMENFPDTAEEFRREGAVIQIGGPSELAGAIESLFADAGRRMEVGQKARALAGARGGATERAFREVERLTQWSIRRDVKTLPLFVPLWLLSRLWTLGSGQARARTRRRKLETPVVSVGGITVGGSGKTPCVIYLAQQLNAAGTRNGILTRGYRRRNAQQVTILAGGSSAPVSLTGDEAQLLLRASGSPIGIGADRHAAGKAIQERFQPSVMLLDDGFQHWKLERALDIVLIDALDPFGGSAPFPLGRLREPLEALGRADIFLLTRAGKERPLPAIEAGLRQYNQDAPVFRCHVALRGCIDGQTGQQSELPERVMAFCGLANPASFWQTLAELGCRPLAQRQFRDHHRYRRGELQDLAARAKVLGAEALVTTEKDVMNLPEGWQEAVAPLGVLSVKIGLEVEDAEGFLARIDRSLAVAAR